MSSPATPASASRPSVALVLPARHLLEGAGAAQVFKYQARALRAADYEVTLVAIAPSTHKHSRGNFDALRGALAELAENYLIMSDTRPIAGPGVIASTLLAGLRGRWPLAADLAVSRFVDASKLQDLSFDAVICNYLQCVSTADALVDPSRQILILHDLDPGPIPDWLCEFAKSRGAVATLNREEAQRLTNAGVKCSTLRAIQIPGDTTSLADNLDADAAEAIEKSRASIESNDGWKWWRGQSIDLLFVGGSHPHNVEGLRSFVRDCFAKHLAPRGVNLVLAGEAGSAALAGLNVANIAYLGRVENLTPLYAASRVIIAPLLDGTGGSIKVREAVAAGKPLLGTPAAWRGSEVGADIALELPFDQRWAEKILALLQDRNARDALFQAGLRTLLQADGEDIADIAGRVARR